MIILGCLFGVGPSMITLASIIGYKDPFLLPTSDQQRAQLNKIKYDLSQGYPSDFISILKAFQGYATIIKKSNYGLASQYCDNKGLSSSVMSYVYEVHNQLLRIIEDFGIRVDKANFQRNNGNIDLIMALVGISMYPDVGVRVKVTFGF